MSKTAATAPTTNSEDTRPEPDQEPPKTYVVNTAGTILPEEIADKDDPTRKGAPGDLKRPWHYRNVWISLVGLLVIILVLMAVFGG